MKKDAFPPMGVQPDVIKEQLVEVEAVLQEVYALETSTKQLQGICLLVVL